MNTPMMISGVAALLLASATAGAAAGGIAYRLENVHGRLSIVSSRGETIPWTQFGVSSERVLEVWQAKQHTFVDAGVQVYQLSIWPAPQHYFFQPFWSRDGRPVIEPHPPMTLGDQATWLLEQNPEARFFIRFGMHPDVAWRSWHKEHYAPMRNALSPFYNDSRSAMPSIASELWLTGAERMARDIVAWCERQPWRDHIIGYSLFPLGEGTTEVGYHGDLFDLTPVMQEAFQAYVRQHYPDDKTLQDAWRDETVTRDTVTVPTKDEWLAKRDHLKLMHWPDPLEVQRERDYFKLQKTLFHRFWNRIFDAMADATRDRPVILGYDIFKQPMIGWMHDADFDGAWRDDTLGRYGNALLASGSLGLGPLLDHPGMHALQTPGMYYNRAMGYAWETEGLSDSLVLRGKLNYMEADMRTWVLRDRHGTPLPAGTPIADAGVFMTPPEMRAGFDRTLAWALSRNQMFYYMNVWSANWWYDDAVVAEKIASQHEVITRMQAAPWVETTDAICLVIDDESPLYEDFSAGYQHLAVQRQIEENLALCGVPYRIHLLSDLARDNFPPYKVYLFPNLFRITPEIEAVLQAKVLRDGRVAIFGPATGIVGEEGLSADAASRLLGVPMEIYPKRTPRRVMFQDYGHPISRRLPQQLFGSTWSYGPLLLPVAQRLDPATGAVPLGNTFFHYFFDRPGLFVRDFGRGGAGGETAGGRGADDYAVVFSAAVPLPPALLRECARYAGANIWSEENAVIYAADNFVALHTVRRGPHTIQLPRLARVWDLNANRQMEAATDRIIVDSEPPATFLFQLGD